MTSYCNACLQFSVTLRDRASLVLGLCGWESMGTSLLQLLSTACPLNYCKDKSIQMTLQDNSTTGPDSQCGYKHSGVQCGGCQPGLSLVLGCLHCSNAYISLVLPFALAGLVLVLFIKVLDFTVCQGTINRFIFYANIINANNHLYYIQPIRCQSHHSLYILVQPGSGD